MPETETRQRHWQVTQIPLERHCAVAAAASQDSCTGDSYPRRGRSFPGGAYGRTVGELQEVLCVLPLP